MNARAVFRLIALTLTMAALLIPTGCSKFETGQYADAKETWDPPGSTDQHDLRNRAATTQRDN